MKLLKLATLFLLLFSVVSAEEKRFSVPVNDSPWKGSKDALVTIIEFIDFQ